MICFAKTINNKSYNTLHIRTPKITIFNYCRRCIALFNCIFIVTAYLRIFIIITMYSMCVKRRIKKKNTYFIGLILHSVVVVLCIYLILLHAYRELNEFFQTCESIEIYIVYAIEFLV